MNNKQLHRLATPESDPMASAPQTTSAFRVRTGVRAGNLAPSLNFGGPMFSMDVIPVYDDRFGVYPFQPGDHVGE